jgi:hypothetical protein
VVVKTPREGWHKGKKSQGRKLKRWKAGWQEKWTDLFLTGWPMLVLDNEGDGAG